MNIFVHNKRIGEENLTNLYTFGKLSKTTFKNFYF